MIILWKYSKFHFNYVIVDNLLMNNFSPINFFFNLNWGTGLNSVYLDERLV